MKILILDNFFNLKENQNRFYIYYKRNKIKNLISKELNKSHKNIEFKIITNNKTRFYIKENIEVELLSELRSKIDREEFLNLKKKIIENVKRNFRSLFNNTDNLKTFYIYNMFIGKLIQNSLSKFYKTLFGEYELLKKILQTEIYDKVLLFNFNSNFIKIFRDSDLKFNNIEVYQDSILNLLFNRQTWFFMKYVLYRVFFFQKNKIMNNHNKKNITFIVNTKNCVNSVKEIVNLFKKHKKYDPIYYFPNRYIPKNKIHKFLKFLIQIRKIWLENQYELSKNFKYGTLNLDYAFKEYYYYKFIYLIVEFFSNFHHFKHFFKLNTPSLICITYFNGMEPNLFAKYCEIKHIPTVYVPHAAISDIDDLITKTNINYLAVPGKHDKDYFLNRGKLDHEIIISGRPVYEKLYENKIEPLSSIKNMFNNKIYKFRKEKFTILFTSHKNSNIKIISTIINSLRELDLLDKLIIKLHPKENEKSFKKILKELNVEVFTVKDYNILELIKSCNLLLSAPSTTILEAMIIGTPVILLDFINYEFVITRSYLFLEEEYLIKVINPLRLTDKLKELINNKELYAKYSENLKRISKKYSFYDIKEIPTKKIAHLFLNLTDIN